MTSFRRFGMLFISFRQYSGVISLTQTSFIAFSNSLALLACFSATLFFTTIHRFSIGFKSGLLPGQSRTLTFFDFKNVVTILERWHGAPSCMKISQLWTVMWSLSFSSNSWRYLWPFMDTPFGRKNNPAVPFTDMPPHIMTLGGCFIVCTVNFSLNRCPEGLRMKSLRELNCCNVDSSENNTFSHCWTVQLTCFLANANRFSFMVGVRRGFLAGLQDFKPKSFTSLLLTVLRLTLIPVSNSCNRIFFAELIEDRVAARFIAISFRGVVFRGLPGFAASAYDPVWLNFTMELWTAVLLHLRRLLISRSVYPSCLSTIIWARTTSESDLLLPILGVTDFHTPPYLFALNSRYMKLLC